MLLPRVLKETQGRKRGHWKEIICLMIPGFFRIRNRQFRKRIQLQIWLCQALLKLRLKTYLTVRRNGMTRLAKIAFCILIRGKEGK